MGILIAETVEILHEVLRLVFTEQEYLLQHELITVEMANSIVEMTSETIIIPMMLMDAAIAEQFKQATNVPLMGHLLP